MNIQVENADLFTINEIDKTTWFKTMNGYPTNIRDFSLLLQVTDKLKLFNDFDLKKICAMGCDKLDVIYAIIMIVDKLYSGHLDYIVKNIFLETVLELFDCNNLSYYNMLTDQLTQDIDVFVSDTIENRYIASKTVGKSVNKTFNVDIKNKFVQFLTCLSKQKFYKTVFRKLGSDFKKLIQDKNCINQICDEYKTYVCENVDEVRNTMNLFLDKIFDNSCSCNSVKKIYLSLVDNIDLNNLFLSNSIQLDNYLERKIDLDYEKEKYSCILNNQYKIYNSSTSALDPFINNNFAKSDADLITAIKTVSDSISHKFIDLQTQQFISCISPKTLIAPSKICVNKLYKLISDMYKCKITYFSYNNRLKMRVYGSNFENHVMIYHKFENFHTLHKLDSDFTPCYTTYPTAKFMSDSHNRTKNTDSKPNLFINPV